MFNLPEFDRALRATLGPLAAERPPALCVALSGGLDSTVLLVALAGLHRSGAFAGPIRAVHVDHGLHADSARWSSACSELAGRYGVDFLAVRVDAVPAAGDSPEATARIARYAALRRALAPGEVLLTAHHADDQLETLLLQWLRGGGLAALAGMAALAPDDGGCWHARPLLGFRREALRRWAASERLAWLEDPSNLDQRFDRNYLRHRVLPPLLERWPAAARTAGRVAGFAREAVELEAAVAAGDLPKLLQGRSLPLAGLLQLPAARQRLALRAWLRGLGLPMPAARTLDALLHDVTAAAGDRIPETRWPGAVVRRFRGVLYADGGSPAGRNEGTWSLPLDTQYAWNDASCLQLVRVGTGGMALDRLPDTLTVRRRRHGERVRLAGDSHHRSLRKWLQQAEVLPWRRDDLPLLCDAGGRPLAIGDLACTGDFAARGGEMAVRVAWQGRGLVTGADVRESRWPAQPAIG